MEKRTRIKTSSNKQYIGFLFIAPWIIGFLVFQLYPFVSSFVYSFSQYNLASRPAFIGIKNYVDIFTKDDQFWNSLKVTMLYVLMAVPMKLAFALFIAMLLNVKLKYINVFRTVYYLPSIFGGSVAVAVLWRFLFSGDGLINYILGCLKIPPVGWLSDPDIALFSISLLTVWQFGSSMVIFLAGLKQIPQELYESGRVDGASKPRMFFTITIPLLTPIIFFNFIMQMVFAFQDFTGAFVVTNGGPMKATYLYAMKLYDEGFLFFKMGYASALSWVMFIILMALTALTFKSSAYWTYYEDGGDF
jgi:oligogalacturonide transport system permease protein